MSEIEPQHPEEVPMLSDMEPQPLDFTEETEEHPAETVPPEARPGRRIHPLATFLAGLVLGILIGFMGRPSAPPSPGDAPATPEPEIEAAAPTRAPERPASNTAPQELVDTIIAETRHFKGDPNAPVTIIEFSDFQ